MSAQELWDLATQLVAQGKMDEARKVPLDLLDRKFLEQEIAKNKRGNSLGMARAKGDSAGPDQLSAPDD